MRRRKFLSYALSIGVGYGTPLSEFYAHAPGGVIARERPNMPPWAPSAGRIVTISYAAGFHPNGANGGAVLEEINPRYQTWNPAAPRAGPYGGTSGNYYFSSINAYCGAAFNTNTRQIVCYGAGHSAFNVPAPFAFDLNDLTWKWLDAPLPIDGLDQIRANGKSVPPSQADIELYYPPSQFDYAWCEWKGDYSGWGAYGRAGKIQPNPGHSRARLIHIPATSAGNLKGSLVWNATGTGILGGVNGKCSHLFDFGAASWSRMANQYTYSGGVGIAHDPVSNKLVLVGESTATTRLGVYDVAMKTWSVRNSTNSITTNVDGGGNILHESSGLYLIPFAKNSGGSVAYYDGVTFGAYACPVADIVGAGSFTWTTLTVTGASWPLNGSGNNNFIGWAYCPVDGCLYTINGVNGSNKYWKMTPPVGDKLSGTWLVTVHTFVSGTLVSLKQTSMVFNKLKWDARSCAFIWFGQDVSNPVQAFRPEGL